MFDASDPRATLAGSAQPATFPASFAPADYVRYYEMQPQESAPGARTWLGRGQNLLVAYSEAKAGAVLDRAEQPDEFAVILPDRDAAVEVSCGGQTERVEGYHLVFVPPGDSRVRVLRDSRVYRVFTTRATDLTARCANAGAHAVPHETVAPVIDWPAPRGGLKIRAYSLDVAPEPGRFGRIWRCTTLMINWLEPFEGPRDPAKLSPHHHDDFEQCSLAVEGDFRHHLRWPWTTNKAMWREDEHEQCAAPSIAVIPPPAVHTTEAIGPGRNQLIDLFCPPRMDFSLKPGWVLNAGDYPMPA
jgi:hypothetical protein